MLKLLIAAPQSNTGKTAVTCGILELANRKGLNPCAFKCGPDYIDPMFHKAVLEIESHNLDIFLSGKRGVEHQVIKHSSGHGAAICEGVMGYYDGVGMTSEASSWQVASCGGFKTLLVIRPKGAALSLAAMIKGMTSFRKDALIEGIFLNDCSEMLFKSLAPMLEEETGLPVIGYLPHMEEASFESRHLGLYTAGEIENLRWRIEKIADEMEKTVDFSRLAEIYKSDNEDVVACHTIYDHEDRPVIAIAKDDAFNFIYGETVEAFIKAGSDIKFFSPLQDEQVPLEADAVYLPGGYPEIYARELSENLSMIESLRSCRKMGMPIVAECGGFLYLGKNLEDDKGNIYPMVGILDGEGRKQEKLVRFGYSYITAKEDSLLFERGQRAAVHEFHYWDSSHNGEDFLALKGSGNRKWECGFADETLYAAFPHLYFAGDENITKRFVEAACRYRRFK